MNKSLVLFFLIISLIFTGCSEDEETHMIWSVVTESPDNITWSSNVMNGLVYVSINVEGDGGDLIMTCENAKELDSSFSHLGVYDNGWATFSIQGTKLICHFPVVNSEKQSELEQITVCALIDGEVRDTNIRITRTFGKPSTNQ